MKKQFNPNDWYQKPTNNDNHLSPLEKEGGQSPVDLNSSPVSEKVPDSDGRRNVSSRSEHMAASSSSNHQKVLALISQIQSSGTDIAPDYGNWRNIGFAFADEFGEQGRDLFHQISQFYHDYTHQEADKQYNRCLKSKGHGITIATFFYWAHRSGLSVHHDSYNMPENPSPSENGNSEEPGG